MTGDFLPEGVEASVSQSVSRWIEGDSLVVEQEGPGGFGVELLLCGNILLFSV